MWKTPWFSNSQKSTWDALPSGTSTSYHLWIHECRGGCGWFETKVALENFRNTQEVFLQRHFGIGPKWLNSFPLGGKGPLASSPINSTVTFGILYSALNLRLIMIFLKENRLKLPLSIIRPIGNFKYRFYLINIAKYRNAGPRSFKAVFEYKCVQNSWDKRE